MLNIIRDAVRKIIDESVSVKGKAGATTGTLTPVTFTVKNTSDYTLTDLRFRLRVTPVGHETGRLVVPATGKYTDFAGAPLKAGAEVVGMIYWPPESGTGFGAALMSSTLPAKSTAKFSVTMKGSHKVRVNFTGSLDWQDVLSPSLKAVPGAVPPEGLEGIEWKHRSDDDPRFSKPSFV